jgi:hypothetical protein
LGSFVIIAVVALIIALSLIGIWLLALSTSLRRVVDSWPEASLRARGRGLSIMVLIALGPWLLFKAFEISAVLSRVPEPLEAMWIDYRLEDDFGSIGMPGDNETGFVEYRLTPTSARWARSKGAYLGRFLDEDGEPWSMTPVDDVSEHDRWHSAYDHASRAPHSADVREYLDHYGFWIPLADAPAERFNRVIRSRGSFYKYGAGGSITVIDPRGGKVYFAYAG